MANENVALVLGATGGIGGEVARQLRSAGWEVRALKRGLGQDAGRREGIAWIRGDAMNREDVTRAARGCSVIVHAVNPPGYRKWSELVLPMLDNTVAAAIAERATIVLPGTVYNYGPDAFPLITEEFRAPQRPLTGKGAIRVEFEQRLKAASGRGARVIIVRAGDFFGPQAGNNWFSQGLVKPDRPISAVSLPGDRCRSSMVLPAGRGARHGRASRPSHFAGAVRHLCHGWALGCRRHRDGGGHSAHRRASWRTDAKAARLTVVAGASRFTLRRHAARTSRGSRYLSAPAGAHE